MDCLEDIVRIEACEDLLERALRLAGLVTKVFKAEGWDLVVVGGSAVEFYTEGSYMSGDVDLCRTNARPIPLRLAQTIMGRLGATGGPRSWKVAGLFVDLLGLLENEARTPFRSIETPSGTVYIIPLELAVVERTLVAVYPKADAEAREVAKKIMAVCVGQADKVDWGEIDRLAGLPDFNIRAEVQALRKEVSDGI